MRVSTDLLWRYLSAAGRTIAGTAASDRQGDVVVPNQLLATIQPLGPILRVGASGATVRDTVHFEQLTLVGPATAFQAAPTLMARGTWRIQAYVEAMADFSNGSAGAADPLVRLQLVAPQPGGQANTLLTLINQANVPVRAQGTWDFCFPVDGFAVQTFLSATVAAQNYIASFGITLTRLQ